jgi:hypothetical protein
MDLLSLPAYIQATPEEAAFVCLEPLDSATESVPDLTLRGCCIQPQFAHLLRRL